MGTLGVAGRKCCGAATTAEPFSSGTAGPSCGCIVLGAASSTSAPSARPPCGGGALEGKFVCSSAPSAESVGEKVGHCSVAEVSRCKAEHGSNASAVAKGKVAVLGATCSWGVSAFAKRFIKRRFFLAFLRGWNSWQKSQFSAARQPLGLKKWKQHSTQSLGCLTLPRLFRPRRDAVDGASPVGGGLPSLAGSIRDRPGERGLSSEAVVARLKMELPTTSFSWP
mmetsp:Transcript_75264/g.218569  ORF Transcript_75264/g.218569 Transcript_75264/m.218569 type:complete len:224 (+) Transcript_75264:631-1302(+)